MNKYTMISIVIVIAVFCWIASCDAAEFTVDERSLLHIGASAAFGAGLDAVLYTTREANGFTARQRVTLATIGGSIPGLVKESILDGYFDYGDMTFNVAGALVGALVSEAACDWIYADGKYIGFQLRW